MTLCLQAPTAGATQSRSVRCPSDDRTADRIFDPHHPPARTSSRGPRFKLIAQVRAEIAAGTYETDAKLNYAIARMLEKG